MSTLTDRTAYRREWYRKNREHCLQNKKEYYIANKEKIIQYQQQWRDENRDKKHSMDRSWKDRHLTERSLQNHVRRARIRASEANNFRKEDICNWTTKICGLCYKPIETQFHIDHIVPLAKGGTHTVENVHLTHPTCNLSKGSQLLIRE